MTLFDRKIPIRFIIEQVSLTTLGALISAIGMNLFLVPHKLIAGGFGGLALFTHYLVPTISIGWWILIYNVPVFLIGLKVLGHRFLLGSLYGTVMLAAFVFATQWIADLNLVHNTLLSAIFGGILGGVGAGLSMRINSSLGGTDIIGAIIMKRFSISIGTVSFAVNVVIVMLGALVFGADIGAYAMASIFAGTLAIDKTIRGINTSKAIYIMTSKPEEIASLIMKRLNRGVTFLQGEGAFYANPRKIIYCVVTLRELARVKYYVSTTDPQAFMSVADVSEVMGKGFRPSPF